MVCLNVTTLQPTEEPSISVQNLVESITRTESEHAKQENCRAPTPPPSPHPKKKLQNCGIASIMN
jgi:hypothetical protein